MFGEYDERILKSVTEQSPFHNLSYKLGEEQTKIRNTCYVKIVRVKQFKLFCQWMISPVAEELVV